MPINDQAKTISILRGADDPQNPNHRWYNYLLNTAPQGTISISNKARNDLSSTPQQNNLAVIHNRLVWVGRITRAKPGGLRRDYDQITVWDAATGQSRTFSGKSAGSDSIWHLDNWLNSLPSGQEPIETSTEAT